MKAPVIRTAFRDHKEDGTRIDHIGEAEFFVRSDYDNADHQIWGSFDGYGQFRGSVSVYGEVVEGHVINWQGGKGRPTACGPFRIRFAAVEGLSRQSTLPSVEHARILHKAGKIGGLYIYRDGVRIQPYGNTDYDWLEIELRRTKSASYYYFSYRQMFGFVEIGDIIFGERSAVLIDPSEERLKTEFAGVMRTCIPMHAVIRIDQVDKQGVAKIVSGEEAKGQGNVTPFPVPMFTPGGDPGSSGT